MAENITWTKSSHTGNEGQCVEVAAWRKSTRSGDASDCVEVAAITPRQERPRS